MFGKQWGNRLKCRCFLFGAVSEAEGKSVDDGRESRSCAKEEA